MRSSAKKLLSQLVQEAFSYELSLNRPVDPVGGSNATIEQNPQAVKDLIEVPEGRKLLDEAYAKMTTYAKYEFKTDVGYHGLVNSSAIGGGWLMSMESLETAAEEGSVLSMEDLDDFYHFRKDKPKVTRHTQLPFEQQNLKGIEGELSALYAAIRNLELDDKELALAEKIYSTNKLYVDASAGKFDALKEIDTARYQFYLRMYKHHQDENATFYSVLSDLIKGKGEIVDFTNAFWGWIEAGEKTNDTMAKALAQFKSGHEEVLAPCFELTEKAAARAKLFPFYEQFVSRGKKLFDNSNENNSSSKFEELCEDYVDKSQELANLFIPAGSSIADCREWLKREHAATIDMEFNHREYVKSTDTSFRGFYKEYRTFLEALQNFLLIGSNMFGAIACSVRNVRRTKIMLLEIIFKARAGEFTMEGLEEDLGVDQLLLEGAKYSEEGIVDFLKKIFKIKKKRPTSDELYLEELEKECKAWKNPSARAIAMGGIRDVPEELLVKLRKIAEDDFSPSMWRLAALQKFYRFACECNKIEDLGSILYEELIQAQSTDEILSIVDKMRTNIKAFLELCKRHGIDKKKRPEFTPVPDTELYRDVTANLNASMTMLERGWSSREGGSWLIFETKYYGWFESALEDGDTNDLIDQIDEDQLRSIQNEISDLVSELRDHFNWSHHPIHDIEQYIIKARLEVLKYGEAIEEGKVRNVAMEEVDDQEVIRLLSQGVQVSQEGFLELVRKLFSKKPEKPDQKLERLERESKAWKNPTARALVEGNATELPPKVSERLVKLSERDFAPCQWQSKEMKPFLDFYIEAANTLVDYDEGFYHELKEANDRKAVEDVLKRARENIKSHIALAKKHKMSLKRSPQYVEVPPMELYLDLTKRFADSVKLAEKAHGKNGYFLIYTTQYYGWFFGTVEELDAAGFEDFSQDETDKIIHEFGKLDDEFNDLFDWGCSPDDDIRNFLKKGRLALLEAGEAIELGKEITLSMEGFFTDVFNRMRGKKPVPVVNPEPTPTQRPDKLGFGYEDASVLAEEFLEQTKHRTGVFDIEKLAEVKFKIPQSLLATPVANRNNILHWFDTNAPESKEQVEAFYKAFEERVVDLDTAVLMVWNTPKYQRLVRLWSQVAKEVSKYPFTNPSQADFKNLIHFWAHNGLAELTKSSLKIDNLGEYRYGDLLSDLCDGGKLPTPLELEKAATGSNPLYAQIGTFNTYRHWATANVIGQENHDCMRLFGKLEDKYCSVEFEWRAVLTDLLVLSWHIGNLSGKRA